MPENDTLLDAPRQSQGGPGGVRGPPGRVGGVRGGLAHLRPRQLPHQLQEPGGGGGLPGGAAAHAAGPRGLQGRHHAHVKGEEKGLGWVGLGESSKDGRSHRGRRPPLRKNDCLEINDFVFSFLANIFGSPCWPNNQLHVFCSSFLLFNTISSAHLSIQPLNVFYFIDLFPCRRPAVGT